jgi:hypothetical protein
MNDGLPTTSLSAERHRHVIVVQDSEDVYHGHPTALLMPDGMTIFCVCTYGHGGRCGPMACRRGAGQTWVRLEDRLPEGFQRHS